LSAQRGGRKRIVDVDVDACPRNGGWLVRGNKGMDVGSRERTGAKTKGRICQGGARLPSKGFDSVSEQKMMRRTCRLTVQSKRWRLTLPNAGLGQALLRGRSDCVGDGKGSGWRGLGRASRESEVAEPMSIYGNHHNHRRDGLRRTNLWSVWG
jgi:hypothetical protein